MKLCTWTVHIVWKEIKLLHHYVGEDNQTKHTLKKHVSNMNVLQNKNFEREKCNKIHILNKEVVFSYNHLEVEYLELKRPRRKCICQTYSAFKC